jgi:hypothetical protein
MSPFNSYMVDEILAEAMELIAENIETNNNG